MVYPKLFICFFQIGDEVQVEKAEGVDQLIMGIPCSKPERNILFDEITADQCFQKGSQDASGQAGKLTDFLPGKASSAGI